MKHNEITSDIIEAAIKIHRALGPGLMESVYENVLAHELDALSRIYVRQYPVEIRYESLVISDAFRADLIVENAVIVELKSVEALQAVHVKQLQTYLKLMHLEVGLLINFNVPLLKDGIRRFVCDEAGKSP